MEHSKDIFNLTAIADPEMFLTANLDPSTTNRYIRIKKYSSQFSSVAKFCGFGITTNSTLNIPNLPTHEISIYPAEQWFHRAMAVVGQVYHSGHVLICIPTCSFTHLENPPPQLHGFYLVTHSYPTCSSYIKPISVGGKETEIV